MDMTDDPRDGGTWTGSYTVGRVVFNGSPEPVRHLHGELTVNGEKFNLCRECGSAIKDDILCKRCKRLFEQENEINALKLALRNLDNAIAAYFASTYGSAKDIAQASMEARRLLDGDHSALKGNMVNDPPTNT
jgi:hypothetical protein